MVGKTTRLFIIHLNYPFEFLSSTEKKMDCLTNSPTGSSKKTQCVTQTPPGNAIEVTNGNVCLLLNTCNI